MFSVRPHWGFDWHEFITGVLFLFTAYIVLFKPGFSLAALSVIFGFIAIVSGLTTISGYTKLRNLVGNIAIIALVIAILDILVGLIFLFSPKVGIVTIGYLLAFWFIIDSIERLLVAGNLKELGQIYYFVSMIFDIFTLLVGVMLLINPVIAVISLTYLIAIYLVIFGINAILLAFARR